MARPEIDKTVRKKHKTKKHGGIEKDGGGRVTRAATKHLQELLDARSEANAKSRLLSLPGELRNKIYDFAIGGHEILVREFLWEGPKFTPRAAPQGGSHKDFDKKAWTDLFNLSLTCRQLRQETRLLPFRLNTLTVLMSMSTVQHLATLAREKKDSIRSIAFLSKIYDPYEHILEFLDEYTNLETVVHLGLLYPRNKATVEKFAAQRGLQLVEDIYEPEAGRREGLDPSPQAVRAALHRKIYY